MLYHTWVLEVVPKCCIAGIVLAYTEKLRWRLCYYFVLFDSFEFWLKSNFVGVLLIQNNIGGILDQEVSWWTYTLISCYTYMHSKTIGANNFKEAETKWKDLSGFWCVYLWLILYTFTRGPIWPVTINLQLVFIVTVTILDNVRNCLVQTLIYSNYSTHNLVSRIDWIFAKFAKIRSIKIS